MFFILENALPLRKINFMSDFDIKARTWDSNPMNTKRSSAISENMTRRIPLNENMVALDFGAGTGILSFMLADKLKSITMMDTSREMVNVMQEKVQDSGIKNLSPVFFNLVEKEYGLEKFDLIFSQLVLHHIEDVDSLLNRFGKMINDGGFLAIADLYTENGSFHGEGFAGHNGFDEKEMTLKLENAGFKNIEFENCFVVEKMTVDGLKNFPVFVLIASK